MGMYTDLFRSNTTALSEFAFDENEFTVLEGYDSEDALLLLAQESCENMNIDFKDSMKHEFMEATLELRQLSGETIEEGTWDKVKEAGSSVFGKLKEIIKKFAAKLYSIYTAAINKIESLLSSDYNKFYTKYKAKWDAGKSNYKEQFSYRALKKPFVSGLAVQNAANNIDSIIGNCLTSNNAIEDDLASVKDGTYMAKLIETIIPGMGTDNKGSYKKELKNALLDEKKFVDLTSEVISNVENTLSTKDLIKNMKKAQKDNMSACKKMIDTLNKAEKASKKSKDNSAVVDLGNRNIKTNTKMIQLLKSMISVFQTVMSITNNAYIKANKINLAQCKAIFTKVVGGVRTNEAKDKVLNKESADINDIIEAVTFDEVMADLA